jgi:hypothetical protein
MVVAGSPQPRLTLLGCSALPLAGALPIQSGLAVVGADDIIREQTGIEDGEIDEVRVRLFLRNL